MKFYKPIVLESFYYRISGSNPTASAYYELYDGNRLILRKDVKYSAANIENKKWEKADHPVHGMSFCNKIVFSHGFEIDVLKFRMYAESA